MEDVASSKSFKIFFQTEDSRNVLLWIKFVLCIIIFISFIIVPFTLWKVIHQNSPIIDPFNEIKDNIFHSTKCPKVCSGALLEIDRRMCFDFVGSGLFRADINRPIYENNKEVCQKSALEKYIRDTYTLSSPFMTIFRGYTFHYKNYLFWFLIKHIIFVFLSKFPFSRLIPDLEDKDRDFMIRKLISYSFSILICLIFLIENIKNFRTKFVRRHDLVLSIIVNFLIMVISVLGLVNVAVINDVFKLDLSELLNNDTFLGLQVTSFILMVLCFVVIIIFLIYSIPKIKSKIFKKKSEIPYHLFNLSEQEIKNQLIECLWKPFWDNLFKDYDIFKENTIEIPQLIQNYMQNKDLSGIDLSDYYISPELKLMLMNRRKVKSDKLVDEENIFDCNLYLI